MLQVCFGLKDHYLEEVECLLWQELHPLLVPCRGLEDATHPPCLPTVVGVVQPRCTTSLRGEEGPLGHVLYKTQEHRQPGVGSECPLGEDLSAAVAAERNAGGGPCGECQGKGPPGPFGVLLAKQPRTRGRRARVNMWGLCAVASTLDKRTEETAETVIGNPCMPATRMGCRQKPQGTKGGLQHLPEEQEQRTSPSTLAAMTSSLTLGEGEGDFSIVSPSVTGNAWVQGKQMGARTRGPTRAFDGQVAISVDKGHTVAI